MNLLTEWVSERNDPLAPWTVTTGSHKEIWCRCKRGHEWKAAVYTRRAGHGCPYCSRLATHSNKNDFASCYPLLAAQWHPMKNGDLSPEDVSSDTKKKVWWRCEKGHEWQANVSGRISGDGCPVCASRKLLPGFNDLASQNPELAAQWHPTKNGTLTPDQVFPGSSRHAWWQCEKGHVWQAVIASRAKGGCGCPYCAGKKLLTGYNDLKTIAPEVAAQWHPTRNVELTPDRVQPYSGLVVWWKCEKGHEWKATVTSRVKESAGCPVCSNRSILAGINDLATVKPELAAQWHPTKNGSLSPDQVGAGSHKRVWWQCEKGHAWRAMIVSRVSSGCGCPVCSGSVVIPGENDLTSFAPVIAAQWHPTKNGELSPNKVRPQSNRQVWWQCEEGHEWRAPINARINSGTGCPYCANKRVLAGFNDLATTEPRIAAQWDEELNGALTPQMISRGSKKKVWWHCSDGHVWQAVVYSRTGKQKTGCPICAGTVSKKRLARMQRLEEETREAMKKPQSFLPERFSAEENYQSQRGNPI